MYTGCTFIEKEVTREVRGSAMLRVWYLIIPKYFLGMYSRRCSQLDYLAEEGRGGIRHVETLV